MNAANIPPVTDHLPISIRAYAEATYRELVGDDAPPAKPVREPLPASPYKLIFDTETTTHPGQALRFGTYQFRYDRVIDEAGIFYDPEGVTPGELETLRAYADRQGLILRTRESFVDEVFFARAYALRATIIGFNLPFDISRIAISHNSARANRASIGSASRGAFTFRLSEQKIYPNVCVKHMSRRAAMIWFAGTMRQRMGRGERNRGFNVPVRRGHFIDIRTLAGALFARGFSLASLCAFLKVEHPKLEYDDFDAPISDEMIRYAVADVQATWECYLALTERFNRLQFTRTIPEKIYSEASIGKAYLKEMGIVPWRKCQPDFPRPLIAKIMGTYYGGRSEVRIRRQVREVMLCDFLSMYPTVCTLMGLWRFVIANGMRWIDATDEAKVLLENIDLAALQSPETWANLHVIVRVIPEGEIFPVRASYAGEAQTTIGANHLTSDTPLWFTLADCIAAKLLTGKCPKIIEAIRFVPGPVQEGLRPIDIGGRPEYRVDPASADFFKRVIELRQSVKKQRDAATGDERAALDIEQNALKIAANATSYGIYIENNVDRRHAPQSLTVLSSTCDPFSFRTDKVELPGTYFHPLLATLITGAARLMLAITERLVEDRGLEWAFCDTDSMAIAKSIEMDRDVFAGHVREIVEWFTALNPYAFGGSVLKIEDVNFALDSNRPEPLFCFAVSSKRYALFNFGGDGKPIMRKVSAHGLGHLLPPYTDADALTDLPIPHRSVLGSGIERWHCDLWYQIICAALAENPDQVGRNYHPALDQPAISRYAATTPELLRWFKHYNADRSYRDQVKPFGFLLSMTAKFLAAGEEVISTRSRGRPKKTRKPKPTAPFDRDLTRSVALAFDRETGEAIRASALKTYAEALAQYHLSPESKFLNADHLDSGATVRRHVRMTAPLHIGKESHDWERQAVLGLSLDSEITYGVWRARHAVAPRMSVTSAVCGS